MTHDFEETSVNEFNWNNQWWIVGWGTYPPLMAYPLAVNHSKIHSHSSGYLHLYLERFWLFLAYLLGGCLLCFQYYQVNCYKIQWLCGYLSVCVGSTSCLKINDDGLPFHICISSFCHLTFKASFFRLILTSRWF